MLPNVPKVLLVLDWYTTRMSFPHTLVLGQRTPLEATDLACQSTQYGEIDNCLRASRASLKIARIYN